MSNRLNAIMKERKVSATELAYKSGVSERYVRFITQGVRSPSLKVAMKMAEILECSVEDIFMPKRSTKRAKRTA